MDNNKPFNQLRSLLEGKTIAKIESPNVREAICCFRLTDGIAFRLHATDLGFWIEEASGPNGYQTLNGLLTDYSHYLNDLSPQYDFDPPNAKVTEHDNVVALMAPDGKSFSISQDHLTEDEKQIIQSPEKKKMLEQWAVFGTEWKTFAKYNEANQ